MKKVLVRGPLLSSSGYGEHSRQVFRYLLEQPGLHIETQILPWGITPWKIDQADPMVSEIINRASNLEFRHDISFQIQLPNEWDPSLAKYNIGVTAAVETDICNPSWTSTHVLKMDKVIVPSKHVKKTLGGNSVQSIKNISVVPEAFFDEIVEPGADIDLGLSTDFNFLTIGILTGKNPNTDRKNLFFLVKWFIEEFRSNPDVGLIIKTSQGRDSIMDRMATKNLLAAVLREIGHEGSPKIYFLHGLMNRPEMTALYKNPKVKAFVSLTRGEGFGLPHLESAASGLPVIATNWSAHKEFLDLGEWTKISYKMAPIDPSRVDNQIFMNGASWAEANEHDFKQKIRKFVKNEAIASTNAKNLRDKIVEEYSWRSVREKYDKVLSGILF